MNEVKQLSQSDIIKEYAEKSDRKKVVILTEALDFMQSYNGRSKVTCIALAMGYETNDGVYYEKISY